jgi:hypothetical protein
MLLRCIKSVFLLWVMSDIRPTRHSKDEVLMWIIKKFHKITGQYPWEQLREIEIKLGLNNGLA